MSLASPETIFKSVNKSCRTLDAAGICQADEPRNWLLFIAVIHWIAVWNNIAPPLILGAVIVRAGSLMVMLPVMPKLFEAARFALAGQVYPVLQSYTALPEAGPLV